MNRRPILLLAAVVLAVPPVARPAAAMEGMGAMRANGPDDPRMRLTPRREARAGDRRRAGFLAERVGRAIAKYRDVERAKADGYRVFGDVPEAEDIHYVNVRRSRAEKRRLDPEKPGSLLYRRRGGRLELVGAMFTAPQGASEAELDRRVPLSQARWHLHTNVCTPRPIWSRRKWARRYERGPHKGRMVYGAFSPIATKAACREVGGRFHAAILGWMVHVYPYRASSARWHQGHGH